MVGSKALMGSLGHMARCQQLGSPTIKESNHNTILETAPEISSGTSDRHARLSGLPLFSVLTLEFHRDPLDELDEVGAHLAPVRDDAGGHLPLPPASPCLLRAHSPYYRCVFLVLLLGRVRHWCRVPCGVLITLATSASGKFASELRGEELDRFLAVRGSGGVDCRNVRYLFLASLGILEVNV